MECPYCGGDEYESFGLGSTCASCQMKMDEDIREDQRCEHCDAADFKLDPETLAVYCDNCLMILRREGSKTAPKFIRN